MTVCKFFLQGYCRYGNNCRFEHQSGGNAGYAYSAQRQLFGGGGGGGRGGGRGNRGGGQSYGGGGGGGNAFQQNPYKWQSSDQNKTVTSQMSTNDVINSLITEITEWESNNMWPFSCVGFEKDCPCLPGFTDTSPEELRSIAYESLQTGNIQSYIQQAQSLAEEYRQKRSQVKQMNLTMKQKLISLIEEYRLTKNKIGSSPTGLFSKSSSGASSSSNPFGSSGSSSFGASGTSTNLFGTSGTSASPFASSSVSNSPFGTSGTTTSAFGSSSGSTSAFGSSSGSTSAFCATSTPLSAFGATGASGSTFGASNSASAFGGNQHKFGESSFGSGTFGSSNQQQGGFSGSTFGTSPLNFATEENKTVSPFGQASSASTGFPSAVTQTQTSFGNQTQATGLFGKPITSPAANLFGSFTSSQPNSGGFQSSTVAPSSFPSAGATASAFPSSSGASASGADTQKYTPLDKLSPEELEAFQAPKFTLGKIPTRPPPKELCF